MGIILDTRTGLTPAEHQILEDLTAALDGFAKLPIQHPSDLQDFITEIHRLQDLLAVRVARREYPDGWACQQRRR